MFYLWGYNGVLLPLLELVLKSSALGRKLGLIWTVWEQRAGLWGVYTHPTAQHYQEAITDSLSPSLSVSFQKIPYFTLPYSVSVLSSFPVERPDPVCDLHAFHMCVSVVVGVGRYMLSINLNVCVLCLREGERERGYVWIYISLCCM